MVTKLIYVFYILLTSLHSQLPGLLNYEPDLRQDLDFFSDEFKSVHTSTENHIFNTNGTNDNTVKQTEVNQDVAINETPLHPVQGDEGKKGIILHRGITK